MSTKKVPVLNIALTVANGIILAFVLLYGFVIEQPCDIDSIYLWCHTHPTTAMDYVGILLTVVGFLYNAVLWLKFYDDAGDKAIVNYAGIIAFALGIISFWI